MGEQGTSTTTETFAQRFVRMRRARGISHPQIIRRVGCTQRALTYWESDEKLPTAAMLEKLADALGTTMGDLWRGRP